MQTVRTIKPKEPKELHQIRIHYAGLDSNLHNWIETEAKEHNVSKSFFIKVFLKDAQENLSKREIRFHIDYHKNSGKISGANYRRKKLNDKTIQM